MSTTSTENVNTDIEKTRYVCLSLPSLKQPKRTWAEVLGPADLSETSRAQRDRVDPLLRYILRDSTAIYWLRRILKYTTFTKGKDYLWAELRNERGVDSTYKEAKRQALQKFKQLGLIKSIKTKAYSSTRVKLSEKSILTFHGHPEGSHRRIATDLPLDSLSMDAYRLGLWFLISAQPENGEHYAILSGRKSDCWRAGLKPKQAQLAIKELEQVGFLNSAHSGTVKAKIRVRLEDLGPGNQVGFGSVITSKKQPEFLTDNSQNSCLDVARKHDYKKSQKPLKTKDLQEHLPENEDSAFEKTGTDGFEKSGPVYQEVKNIQEIYNKTPVFRNTKNHPHAQALRGVSISGEEKPKPSQQDDEEDDQAVDPESLITPDELEAFRQEFGEDELDQYIIPGNPLTATLSVEPPDQLKIIRNELNFLDKLPEPLQSTVVSLYASRQNSARVSLNWHRERSQWYTLLSRPVDQKAFLGYLEGLLERGTWKIDFSRMRYLRELYHWNDQLNAVDMAVPKWVHTALTEDENLCVQAPEHVEYCLGVFNGDRGPVEDSLWRTFGAAYADERIRAFWYLCSKRSEYTGFFYENLLRPLSGFHKPGFQDALKLLETKTQTELELMLLKYFDMVKQRDACWDRLQVIKQREEEEREAK